MERSGDNTEGCPLAKNAESDQVIVQVEDEHPLVSNPESDQDVVQVKKEGQDESKIILSIKQKIRQPEDCEQTYDGSFTIHEVDSKLRNGNDEAYTPQLVSIGPYHYGKENLKEMQDVKFEYLSDLIQRSPVDPLPKYLAAVSSRETEARKGYSRALKLNPEEFVEMMLVDGCFLIEFMLKSYLNDRKDQTNIVKTKMPVIMNDLLLVENQIPFFILKDLFGVYKQQLDSNNQDKNDDSFTIEVLTFFCFSPGDRLDAQVTAKAFEEKKSFYHLLHLYHSSLNQNQDRGWKDELEYEKIVDRMFYRWSESNNCNFGNVVCFIPTTLVLFLTLLIVFIIKFSWLFIVEIISLTVSKLWDLIKLLLLLPLSLYLQFMKYLTLGRIGDYGQWTSGIPNARYLRDTGFKFKKKDSSCFLDVTRSGRTIEIPMLCMQQITTIHYKNLIALEQCSNIYGHGVTSFAKFMDYLIDTEEDVAILRECNIIDNRLGKDEEVAIFFNNLLKGIHIKDEDVLLFDYVQKYYTNGYYKVRFFQWRKKLVPEYFSNPWAVPSMIAAFILLVLTVVQTFYTIYPYYHPR